MNKLERISNLWTFELEHINPPPSTDEEKDRKKKVFAYNKFKEYLLISENRENQKKVIEREAVSEIYQLIGFDSVFQAVWFQAVVGLRQAVVNCRAFIPLIIVSVLVSIATIIGVHQKFEKARKARKGLYEDKRFSSVLRTHISKLEEKGLKFDWVQINSSQSIDGQKSIHNEKLVKLHRIRVGIIFFLTILSALFAWLPHAVMCDKYP